MFSHSAAHGTIQTPPPRCQYSYLLIGKTGVGKSTVLNCLQSKKKVKSSDDLDSCTQEAEWIHAPFRDYTEKKVLHV